MGPQNSSLPGLALPLPENVPVPLAGTKRNGMKIALKKQLPRSFIGMVCDKEWMETNKQKILLLQMYHPLLHK